MRTQPVLPRISRCMNIRTVKYPKPIPVLMYRIPKNGEVVLAIRNVLVRYRSVESQRRLKELVENELNQGDEEYRVSGPRIRKLAIVSGIADVEVHTRGNGKKWKGTKCPVCGTKLTESKNMTVYGDTVTIGYQCPRCTYCTGKDRRAPSRYVFSRRRR